MAKIKKITGAKIAITNVETKDLVQNHVYDISRAKKELGWEPKTSFVQLAEMMVDADKVKSQKMV